MKFKNVFCDECETDHINQQEFYYTCRRKECDFDMCLKCFCEKSPEDQTALTENSKNDENLSKIGACKKCKFEFKSLDDIFTHGECQYVKTKRVGKQAT